MSVNVELWAHLMVAVCKFFCKGFWLDWKGLNILKICCIMWNERMTQILMGLYAFLNRYWETLIFCQCLLEYLATMVRFISDIATWDLHLASMPLSHSIGSHSEMIGWVPETRHSHPVSLTTMVNGILVWLNCNDSIWSLIPKLLG